MTNTVVFRADATDQGGVGHVVRAFALAQIITGRGGRAVFAGEIEAPLARRLLADAGIEVVPAPPSRDGLVQVARAFEARLVHVDHYESFPDARGADNNVLFSAAADGPFGRRAADVIVDGAPRALIEFDDLWADADVCLGPDHLALRAEVAQATRSAAFARDHGARILVMMGGTDALGYGPAVARAVRRIPGVSAVGIVGSESIGADIQVVPRRTDLTSLVEGWDFVVTAAGTTVWELAAMRVPMAVVGVVDNQRDHYDTFVGGELAVGLGFKPDIERIELDELASLMGDAARVDEIVARAAARVDGRGAERIVEAWDGVAADRQIESLTLRRAAMRDAGRLFVWRNEATTRAQSRRADEVDWSSHVAWLHDAIHREDRQLFVGIEGGTPVGTVRLDEVEHDGWEVSVTVAPGARGRGVGRGLVAQAVMRAIDQGGSTVIAELRHVNVASRAVFQTLAFQLEHEGSGWERWVLRNR